MPHPHIPEKEKLREEWINTLKDDSMFMTDVYNETADWWFEKIDQIFKREESEGK